LAQVHTATCKQSGKKLAIKIQHRGLRETSKGDLFALTAVVRIAERLFDEFNLGWICDEIAPNLPKELDFTNEGKNAEAASAHLQKSGLDCVVPRVLWRTTTGQQFLTSERVLTMEFEVGFPATDVERIDSIGICRRETAKLISSVFNAQIFENGLVHCDPHQSNVLLREHPRKKGKPQIVLVDHGLYKRLDPSFQESYARLWTGIVMADISAIKGACERLGVDKMYPLLAAMLTSRPFDEVIERSRTRSLDAAPASGSGDKAVIKLYAQRYLREIIDMLDIVPRQMLLIFKMNDCLRHVDCALGSPANNLVVAGKYASKRVFHSDIREGSVLRLLKSWLSYAHVLIRINSYEMWKWLSGTSITRLQ
jgi:aarF domain-containing kinase